MKFADVKMKQLDDNFNNGIHARLDYGDYQLSIIQSDTSYGGKDGLYEIGVFNSQGMVEIPGITPKDDTVRGFLREYEVEAIMLKMSAITGVTQPTQV